MRAFIGWSGGRGSKIATALKTWLHAVLPELESFISTDLPKGEQWFTQLARELQGSRIGLMCLVAPRLAGEWQLVEVGAVWKASRRGAVFPLCFGVQGDEIPAPLRVFQTTHFDEADFRRLARALARIASPKSDWATVVEPAFAAAWSSFREAVETAMREPDDGVRSPAGFVHEVRGGWWERVRSQSGKTRLSWMWIERGADGLGLTIRGRGYGETGSYESEWRALLATVDPHPVDPEVSYYWEGRHPQYAAFLFGGRCTLQFQIASDGRIRRGSGEFRDVCLNARLPATDDADELRLAARRFEPTTKLVDLVRATPDDVQVMEGIDEAARRQRAAAKLAAWQ